METLNRILLVEDDPDIQAVTRLALETVGGFTVQACNSGPEALAAVDAFHPELILLDVMMPGMDGPSILRALRALPVAQAIPVVFMTARVQPSELAQFRSLGALAVIAKPFDPMRLPEQVREIWSRRHD